MLGNRHVRKNRFKKRPPAQTHAIGFKQVGAVFMGVLIGISVIAAMSLMFIFGHDVLIQCDYFAAGTISVEGESRLTEQQVLDIARVEKGSNIFSVNLQTIRKRLLSDPWIAEAEVCRLFPGTLAIKITEQRPAAVLDFGRYFLVNIKGEIFKEASADEAQGLPVVSGIDYPDWKISGMPGTLSFSAVMEVLRLGKFKGSGLPGARIKRIHVDREMGLTLEVCGAIAELKLGFGGYRAKYDRLARILSYIDRHDNTPVLSSIDLRNPDRIVACPANARIPRHTDEKEVLT